MSSMMSMCYGRCRGACQGEEEDCEELTRNVHVTGKVTVVGDGTVGKTSLLMRYVNGEFLEEYRPTIFENQAVPVNVQSKKILLNLFDTAGQEGYDYLRPLMYPDTDVVLVCFSVNNRATLYNVLVQWQPEIRSHLSKVPILLVGLKTDLRGGQDSTLSQDVTLPSQPLIKDASAGAHDAAGMCFELQDKQLVNYSEGQQVAERIGAKAYFECSAKLNQGLTPIFYEAARLCLRQRRGSSLRKMLSLSRSSRSRPRSFWRAA